MVNLQGLNLQVVAAAPTPIPETRVKVDAAATPTAGVEDAAITASAAAILDSPAFLASAVFPAEVSLAAGFPVSREVKAIKGRKVSRARKDSRDNRAINSSSRSRNGSFLLTRRSTIRLELFRFA